MLSRFNALARAFRATSATRQKPGGIFSRSLLPVAALAATISATGPVLAGDYASVIAKDLDPVTIRVLSDGETYTTVLPSAPAITGELGLYLDTAIAGRVRSWHAWASIQAKGTEAKEQFPEHGQSASYPVGKRPKTVDGDFPFSIPHAAYKDHILDACNARAAYLRNAEGRTNAEIFAEEHMLGVYVRGEMTYDMSGAKGAPPPATEIDGPETDPYDSPVRIICEKSESLITPTAEGPTRKKPKVDIANLKVVSNDSAAVCSVSLVATIQTKAPNTEVKFRFEGDGGQKSGIHTVVTPGNAFVQKGYTYPLSGVGSQTGQIRMVIEGETTKSAWKDYAVICVANDLQAVLMPEATLLEVGATAKKVVYRGHVCPAQAKIIGAFKGRSTISGDAVLTANGFVQEEGPYSIKDGETQYIDGVFELSWENLDGPLQQDVEFALRVGPVGGDEASRLTRTETFSCVKVDKPEQLTSNDPTPPVLTLNATPVEETLHQGFVCPAEVAVDAQALGKDHFEGRAVLVAKQEQSLFESQSQVKEYNLTVADNQYQSFPFRPVVKWSNVPQSGNRPPKQTMTFAFRVVRSGGTLASASTSLLLTCRKPGAPAGQAIGNLTGKPTPPPPRRVGAMATTQANADVTILAPRDRVRKGQIRLSGAKPTQVFDLQFLRKTKSGFKLFNSAQLPGQMTGPMASFNLHGLSGGDWRLRVCPKQSDQFVGPVECATSNFYLPKTQVNNGRFKVPGAESRKPTRVFILPSQGG